ncbi:remorin-like [Juglans microcarpa x Juglans regia]|uniref:remorin-like n=1 Tax=Juglans microcarpa x Juglans regia TaxID=2249226 RepID=UPI001B7F2A36|nr:remorin-like [Juglans microcarpa x Juglans regia]
MNVFFYGYVHAWTNLKEFVDQFDNTLRKKIESENAADSHSFNETIPMVSISLLEKTFQQLYANSKFREVQKELYGRNSQVVDTWRNLFSQTVDGTQEIILVQEKLEKKKAEYVDKMKIKVAMIHKATKEKRAMTEAERGEDLLKAEEMAAKY